MQIQLINNLGTFSSVRDVNNAYPEGGREGDYCHIGEILYVWNKYSLSWDVWEDKNTYQMIIHEGDHDVEHDQQIGGKQKVVGNALFEHDVIVEGRLIYKNLKGLDCGLFPSEAELKEAYPSPTKGMWGLVGTSSPFALYECTEDGTWTLVSSDSKLIDSFDLSAYDSVKDIVNEISSNGYIFYGFAREDTNPIKPSNFKVFYITEPNEGTFVNFDGIVCKSRSALLWDNDTQSWTAHTLYPKCFVDTDMIVDGAVTTEKLKDDSVTEGKIVDGAVSQTKLSADVLSLIEAAGNEVKYILFDDLDALITPQTDTGIYYVYSRKTDMYTQIVGLLLVQTDWSQCQITQHLFSNYKMDAGDGRHVDNEATYYKRHYGVNSSIIEKGKWTDWENAITANVELKTILDDLTTNLTKETKERTNRDDYLDTRITAEVQELNGTIDTIESSLSEGNIRFVSFSDLDTVLGSNPKEVREAIKLANGKHTLKYIVTNNESGSDVFVGYVDMFADGLMHCLTQEFTTNYIINSDGTITSASAHDHKLHKYVRYYAIVANGTDWRGEAWAQGTWTKWNSPVEDVEASVKTKVGYLALVSTTATTTTIGAFADESYYTVWQKNPEKYASYLLTSVEIATSGGGSSVTNCGFYVSEESLNTAYPSPILGMMAFVGTGTTYTIYRCTIAGKWTKTSETFTIELPLDDYTTLEEFNKAVSALQSNIDAEATARQTADESMQADIDAIKTGDLPLVTPSIKANTINPNLWLVYKADGTLVTSSNDKTLNVPCGYKVNFNGCMTWSKVDGYKNPTAMDGGDWGSKALPVSGELSDVVSYSDITEDKTITAKIKAPKQGLVYKNGIIKWADSTDYDSTSVSVKVHFQYKVVAGVSENTIDAASLVALLTNSATLQDGKSKTLTGVTTSSTQYYVYAYPSKLGKLSKIVMNDATPLLDDGFTLSAITVIEPTTGATIEYYVYTSVQKGAFTNVKLDIA